MRKLKLLFFFVVSSAVNPVWGVLLNKDNLGMSVWEIVMGDLACARENMDGFLSKLKGKEFILLDEESSVSGNFWFSDVKVVKKLENGEGYFILEAYLHAQSNKNEKEEPAQKKRRILQEHKKRKLTKEISLKLMAGSEFASVRKAICRFLSDKIVFQT